MRTKLSMSKSLSIALLMLGLVVGALAVSASAETIALSTPTKDNSYFVPGETVTVTYSGMGSGTGYDFTVVSDNGTVVMNAWNVSSTTGSLVWPVTISQDWEGTYTVHAYLNATTTPRGAARSFSVMLFSFEATSDHDIYLPGDNVGVFYYTQRLDDQRALSGGNGHWRMTVSRDNGTAIISDNLGGSFAPTSGSAQGTFSVPLPSTTVAGYYLLYVTFNDTTDMHSQTQYVWVLVSSFNIGVSTDRSTYNAGENVVVRVTARTGGYEATVGVVVTTKVETHDIPNATWVTETGYTVPSQTTGADGSVSYLVTLKTPIAENTEMRVTVSAVKGGSTQEASASFTIRANTGLSIDLSLDKTSYKPGDTMVAQVKFVSTNATLITGSMYLFRFYDDTTGATLALDYIAGTATGAEKSYVIPGGFVGYIDVEVTVYAPDDRTYYRDDGASVFSAALLTNPSKIYYAGGDSISVTSELVSDRITDAPTFIWSVTPASGGDAIAKGTSTPGGKSVSFSFTLPASPDDRYYIDVTAAGSGIVVTDRTSVYLEKYVALQIKVPDKSFKPGDTVTVHYKFVAVNGATTPTTTTITLAMSGGYNGVLSGSSRSYDVAALEGDLSYTIPGSAPENADLQLSATSGYGSTGSAIYMRPSGGAAPASAAANTATWGLVIAVLALFVAVLSMMRKPRNPREAGSDSYSSRSSSYSDLKDEAPKKSEKSDAKGDDPPKSL